MGRTLPTPLLQARDALLGFHWHQPSGLSGSAMQQEVTEDLDRERMHQPDMTEEEEASSREALTRGWFWRQDAVREQYLGLLAAAHAFFSALSQAGGQDLLAERAGLPALKPSQWPSKTLRSTLPALPERSSRFWQCEREAGGRHILGARLLWWCAAAHAPDEFLTQPVVRFDLWVRLPWISTLGREPQLEREPLRAIQDAARYVCDLLVDGAADEAAGTGRLGEEDGPVASGPAGEGGPSAGEDRTHVTLAHWGVGIEHGSAWHKFRRVKGQWQHRGKVRIARGNAHTLLKAFAEAGGALEESEVLKIFRETYSAWDRGRLLDLIKPVLSRLRKTIRDELSLPATVNPLPWDESSRYWRAAVSIGFAVTQDAERVGDERRLRFLTLEEMRAEGGAAEL